MAVNDAGSRLAIHARPLGGRTHVRRVALLDLLLHRCHIVNIRAPLGLGSHSDSASSMPMAHAHPAHRGGGREVGQQPASPCWELLMLGRDVHTGTNQRYIELNDGRN